MIKIRAIAVDDEPHALTILEQYASKLPNIEMLATFQSPLKALPYLEENEVDLLFLDIQMPELTGLQFLNILQKKPRVILTTAYSDYALEGYEYNVADYLLKPFSFERFIKAVQKINLTPTPVIKVTNEQTEVPASNKKTIFIKGDAKNKFYQIEKSEITFIEGMRNYVSIYQKNGERIVTLQNMKSLEEQLESASFLRIHKSYLVNMNQVEMVEGNSVKIAGKQLPIGGSYRKIFFDWVSKRNVNE